MEFIRKTAQHVHQEGVGRGRDVHRRLIRHDMGLERVCADPKEVLSAREMTPYLMSFRPVHARFPSIRRCLRYIPRYLDALHHTLLETTRTPQVVTCNGWWPCYCRNVLICAL